MLLVSVRRLTVQESVMLKTVQHFDKTLSYRKQVTHKHHIKTGTPHLQPIINLYFLRLNILVTYLVTSLSVF